MHHIVFLDRDILPTECPRPSFPHTWAEYPTTSPDQLDERLRNATIVISSKIPLRAETLRRHPSIRFIAVAGTGVDPFDLSYCRQNGIVVSNVAGYAKQTVAEHTFMLMLALSRNLIAYRDDLQAGKWQRTAPFCFHNAQISNLHGKTLGIVGEGAIGTTVAAIARGFDMRVVFADYRKRSDNTVERLGFDELLRQSDVVSLHCPLNDKTHQLMGEEQFRAMKSTALLINTSRGGLIDEAALVTALTERWIAGAGLDVLAKEPPAGGNPLLGLNIPNLIITPHVAWASDEALQAFNTELLANIEGFAAGQPRNRVA